MPTRNNECRNELSADSIGRKLQADFRNFLIQAADCFHAYSFLSDFEAELRELEKTIVRPFNIALFGRVKTGKSSIVNALIGRALTITGCNETTATVNVISHVDRESDLKNRFTVHWKDRPPETFPLSMLVKEWSGKDEKILQENVGQTNYIQLYSDDDKLALHEIIDTPGTDSVVSVHETVAQNFINPSVQEGRKADALVYVFGITATESDEKSLKKFREGCLEGANAYNSIGVIHKWDGLYWDNDGKMDDITSKCKRMREQLGEVVADVVPVSAPLALFAESASSECLRKFFEIVDELKSDSRKMELLNDQEDWDDDAGRRDFRCSVKELLPWACFRIALRECVRRKCKDIEECPKVLLELSGFSKFREILDHRFFKRGAIIRQRQIYSRISNIRDAAHLRISEHCEKLAEDIEYWQELEQKRCGKRLGDWIKRKCNEATATQKQLLEKWKAIDEMFLRSDIPQVVMDNAALEWCEKCDEKCKKGMYDNIKNNVDSVIRPILEFLSGSKAIIPSEEDISGLLNNLAILGAYGVDAQSRKWTEHLRNRINYFLEQRNKRG